MARWVPGNAFNMHSSEKRLILFSASNIMDSSLFLRRKGAADLSESLVGFDCQLDFSWLGSDITHGLHSSK
jgi:hypothetical protein